MSRPKRYYVCGFGSDCDGMDACSCHVFKRKQQAEAAAWNSNDWSDGVQYSVVNKKIAEEYCDGYFRHLPEYYGYNGNKSNRKHRT